MNELANNTHESLILPFSMTKASHFFTPFQSEVANIPLPSQFTFPFFYEPHTLSIQAAKELQGHLETQSDWKHDFGLDDPNSETANGKMFGVLVVRNKNCELGYLSAFSGKLAESNHWPRFVPPVFDILREEGFYKLEEQEVNELNRLVKEAEENPKLHEAKKKYLALQEEYKKDIEGYQAQIRENRITRKQKRKAGEVELNAESLDILLKQLSKESIGEQYFLKDRIRQWKEEVAIAETDFQRLQSELESIRLKRGQRSAALQRKIFEHYTFLNSAKEEKSLMAIFSFLEGGFPPAGAGECAAPKLLHFAFLHQLEPICMAEFWWGKSPGSEIRKHKEFYPACRSKCEPILGHMLTGMDIEENPILKHPSYQKEIEIIYEDDAILVVNKPSGLLSVPGKTLTDSVDERMRKKYPRSETPLIVHRLDMATSGLMLLAKTKEAHKKLQALFIKRTIKKRYIAILEGIIPENSGVVDLPLRLDLDNRPHQLVCYDYGKKARTEYKVLGYENDRTRIHFFPITGRSHQLRVHSAHVNGLNTPIVGDDLYGKKDERLMLHAEWLQFRHPITEEIMEFEVESSF